MVWEIYRNLFNQPKVGVISRTNQIFILGEQLLLAGFRVEKFFISS